MSRFGTRGVHEFQREVTMPTQSSKDFYMTLTKRDFLGLSAGLAAMTLPSAMIADGYKSPYGCCGIIIAILAIKAPKELGGELTVKASRDEMMKANMMEDPEDAGRYLARVLGQKAIRKNPKVPENMGDAIFKAMQRGGHCKSGKKNFQDPSVTKYLEARENWQASVSMQSE